MSVSFQPIPYSIIWCDLHQFQFDLRPKKMMATPSRWKSTSAAALALKFCACPCHRCTVVSWSPSCFARSRTRWPATRCAGKPQMEHRRSQIIHMWWTICSWVAGYNNFQSDFAPRVNPRGISRVSKFQTLRLDYLIFSASWSNQQS